MPEPSTSHRPEVPSEINQRPRRQVKHKFIKTGNRTSLTDELYTTLIGPNSPSAPALIPVVERLSDNVSSFAELLATKEVKLTESVELVVTSRANAESQVTVEQPMAELNSNAKDPVNRAQKTLGIPMRRRAGRQTRTSRSLAQFETEPESNHTPIASPPPAESVDHALEINSMDDDAIVTIEETDDRFEMNSSAFDGIPNTIALSGPVVFAEEVVIEETVTTTELDQPTFGVTCDDAVTAVESDSEPIITEEVNDVIDVSDSLSFLDDSDDSDSRSVVDAPLPSTPLPPSKPSEENDIDENSGSIILVSPSDPLEDMIAGAVEITSTTFEPHLVDDDTANDGDVDETPLNGPRRRSKRKSKSFTLEENSVNSNVVACTFAITKPIDTMKPASNFGNSTSPSEGNAFYESNTKSVTAIGSSISPPPNNSEEENLISSSEDTTQSESNDRGGSRINASSQRPRRETAERVNYSVRRNYAARQSMKINIESTNVACEDVDVGLDIETELKKSVIERPQPTPIEPKFKFQKTEQLRTYQRRQKTKGTKKESPLPPPPSSSSSSSSLSSSSTSASVQSSPKDEQTVILTAQNTAIPSVATEQPFDLIPTEIAPSRPIVDDTSTDGQTEPTIPKRRSAGRPRKSDARRKTPQQSKLSNSIENIATNVDGSIEATEMVEIVASSEQEQVLPPQETQKEIQIEFKTDLDDETKVPHDRTVTEVTEAPAAAAAAPPTTAIPSPNEDELMPKVENLVISPNDKAIENAITAMEVDICKMEIDEETPNTDLESNKELQQQPPSACSINSVDAKVEAVVPVPVSNDNRMEDDSNEQITIKKGKDKHHFGIYYILCAEPKLTIE